MNTVPTDKPVTPMDVHDPTSTASPVTKPLAKGLTKTWNWGQNAQVVAVLLALGGIIAAIVIAAHTAEISTGIYSSRPTHPLVGVGVGVAIGALLWAFLFWLLGTWASAWAESVDARVAS